MASSTYMDLCPGSRGVGIVLWNLSSWEVPIPPKTVIANIQIAEVTANLRVFKLAGLVLPHKEQMEWSRVAQSDGSESPEKEVTQLTSMSPPLEPTVPTQNMMCLNRSFPWDVLNETLLINKKCERFWQNMQMSLQRTILI